MWKITAFDIVWHEATDIKDAALNVCNGKDWDSNAKVLLKKKKHNPGEDWDTKHGTTAKAQNHTQEAVSNKVEAVF